jgi:carbamoylphosphate synthase large subunit
MKKILISAASSPVAASICKYLKENNFYTIGISDRKTDYALEIFDEFHVVPPVSSENFIQIVSKLNFDYYMPWIDEEIEVLINQNIISFSKLSLPSIAVFKLVNDKNAFYNWCVESHFSVLPKTYTVPAFVRQNKSRGSRGAMLVTNQKLLEYFLLSESDFLCQIPKDKLDLEYTVDVFSDHLGNIVFVSPRIREDAKNVSYIGVVDESLIAEKIASSLASKLKLPGMWNFQIFIRNESYYMIEINPRLAGSVIFSILAGFPFSKYLDCLINQSFEDFEIPKMKRIRVERFFSEFVKEF